MALPNPSMSFSPFAILTAEEMNDLVENIESLASGVGIADGSITNKKLANGSMRLGIAKKNTTGTLLGNTYGTYLTVTATSTGRECEVTFSATVGNANSGSNRYAHAKVQCDGVDITPIDIEQYLFFASGTTVNANVTFTVSSAPAAGSHTWTLQMLAGQASAVALGYAVMTVKEIA